LLDLKNKNKKFQSAGGKEIKKVNFFQDENNLEDISDNNINNNNTNNDDDEDEIWRNFDIGTLDFNKFIDSNYTDNEESNSAFSSKNKFPKQFPSTQSPSTSGRKRRKDVNSDDDLAEIKSKRRVIFIYFFKKNYFLNLD
jgi:hypothetical protein